MSLLLKTAPAGILRRARIFTPRPPDNQAFDCWRCPHRWHGLGCGKSSCPCTTSWVDPDVAARMGGAK